MTVAEINELGYKVRGAIYNVYKELGMGLLESVYQEALAIELGQDGIKVEREVFVPVYYKGIKLQSSFRIDLLVENTIIVEVKSVSDLSESHYKQLINYLKLTGKPLGYLVNFNASNILKSIHRVVNNLDEN
jgi:GxxExxY protein